jgi:DNA mismatch endonuclease, patch repair protein
MRVYQSESPELTSKRMSSIRRSNTTAEVVLRRALWRLGLRYRLHRRDLPGTPDIVLSRRRTVIFIDGDFWHGRRLREDGPEALRATFRGERQDYWTKRIMTNASRDDRINRLLLVSGWTVIRVWDSDVMKATSTLAALFFDLIESHPQEGTAKLIDQRTIADALAKQYSALSAEHANRSAVSVRNDATQDQYLTPRRSP